MVHGAGGYPPPVELGPDLKPGVIPADRKAIHHHTFNTRDPWTLMQCLDELVEVGIRSFGDDLNLAPVSEVAGVAGQVEGTSLLDDPCAEPDTLNSPVHDGLEPMLAPTTIAGHDQG